MPSTETQTATGGVTLSALHEANIARQAEWCAGGDPEPDLAFRGNELAGETGEACNVIKKLERERHGWRGSRATKDQLAEELADVVICADLCAVTAGIDLDAAVRDKFNATSEKVGLTTKLAALAQSAGQGRAEPVAWLFEDTTVGRTYSSIFNPEGDPRAIGVRPLYEHPPVAAAPPPPARTVGDALPQWQKLYASECNHQRAANNFDTEACIRENFPQVCSDGTAGASPAGDLAGLSAGGYPIRDILRIIEDRLARGEVPGHNFPAEWWPAVATTMRAALAPAAPRPSEEEIADEIRRLVFVDVSNPEAIERHTREAARAVLALLTPADRGETRAEDGWRPMSSAPQVYQPILLALDTGKHGDISRAPVVAGWEVEGGYWFCWQSGERLRPQPTGWMPLPTPARPAPAQNGGE